MLGSYYKTARVKASSLFWNNFAYKGARLLGYSFRLFQQLYSHVLRSSLRDAHEFLGRTIFSMGPGKTVKIKDMQICKPYLPSRHSSQAWFNGNAAMFWVLEIGEKSVSSWRKDALLWGAHLNKENRSEKQRSKTRTTNVDANQAADLQVTRSSWSSSFLLLNAD